ncbi:ABC transporter ATP-binding protein [Flavobacterium columnare]|uniref:ABC transporter ATP-binding protein n=1 Tax=Flavobacterium columnare TaxID=996 RepID=UPI0040338E4E
MQLEIRNLSKTYSNGHKALDNINLTIKKGMFGLLGQNGAGKSSLMRTIATLQGADSGSIKFNEIDVFKQPNEMRKIIGYLPQEFGVYSDVSATDLLRHIARLKGIENEKNILEVTNYFLNKVNLWDSRNKKLGTFSGGMKQRFGIAQALISDPKIIIVDEPTAGLDPVERNRFYDILSEIGENAVVILSTHIVEDVNTLCNDMAIIGNGKVLITGDPDDIEMSLENKIWERKIKKTDFEKYNQEYNIISSRIYRGEVIITVLDTEMPNGSFWPKATNLEDAYFSVINVKRNQYV